MIRVILPAHLKTLAGIDHEVQLAIAGTVTTRTVLDALETAYPVLGGTIRDYGTLRRRPFLRYFACAEDVSHDSPDIPLPAAIVEGREPFMIVGAISGG